MNLAFVPVNCFLFSIRLIENVPEVETFGFPMIYHRLFFKQLSLANNLFKPGKAHFRKQCAHFFGEIKEEVNHMLWRTFKAFAQNRVLCGNAYRTRIKMALTHHNTASGNQRCCGKSEFIRTKQSTNYDITARTQSAINLKCYARAKSI